MAGRGNNGQGQRRHNAALAPLNITRAAVTALEAIAPRPLNQEQLAAKVHVPSQTLGRVLARLEGEGFVAGTRNPDDRRQRYVQLTPWAGQHSPRPGRPKVTLSRRPWMRTTGTSSKSSSASSSTR